VAFLAQNINGFNDLNEELSGPGDLLSDGKVFTNPTCGICGSPAPGSPALQLCGFAQSRSNCDCCLKCSDLYNGKVIEKAAEKIYSGWKISWAVMLVMASILAQGGGNMGKWDLVLVAISRN
jgi:hypothetical protein